jgi:hypothetical protein
MLIRDGIGATNDRTLPEVVVGTSSDPARLQKWISSVVKMLTVELDIILW